MILYSIKLALTIEVNAIAEISGNIIVPLESCMRKRLNIVALNIILRQEIILSFLGNNHYIGIDYHIMIFLFIVTFQAGVAAIFIGYNYQTPERLKTILTDERSVPTPSMHPPSPFYLLSPLSPSLLFLNFPPSVLCTYQCIKMQ